VAFFSLIDFHAGVTVRTNPCTEFKVVRTVVPHVATVAVQTPVMPKRKVFCPPWLMGNMISRFYR
jgi:hypothetical protein